MRALGDRQNPALRRSSGRVLIPGAAVALDKGNRRRRPPGSRGIGFGQIRCLSPGLENGVDPFPCRLDLIAAHEERLIAAYDIHDKPLIGIGIAYSESLGET